jgi:hypothetical protein
LRRLRRPHEMCPYSTLRAHRPTPISPLAAPVRRYAESATVGLDRPGGSRRGSGSGESRRQSLQ